MWPLTSCTLSSGFVSSMPPTLCRRTSRPKKLWDKLDDMEWVHDKFDLPPEEDDYQVSFTEPQECSYGPQEWQEHPDWNKRIPDG